jgi:hypothetical protein
MLRPQKNGVFHGNRSFHHARNSAKENHLGGQRDMLIKNERELHQHLWVADYLEIPYNLYEQTEFSLTYCGQLLIEIIHRRRMTTVHIEHTSSILEMV